MKKQALLIAVLLMLAAPCTGQARNDHLEPLEKDWTPPVSVNNYRRQLLQLLHAGFSPAPVARYTVMPSFSPEYAWSLERVDGGGYVLLTRKLLLNLWFNKYKKTNARPIAISKDLHDAIAGLFAEVTRQIREPDGKSYIMDGVVYYCTFAGEGETLITGRTHSPNDGSLMWRLTRLCDALMLLPDLEGLSESQLVAEIETLLQDIRKAKESGTSVYTDEGQESVVERSLEEYLKRGPGALSQETIKALRGIPVNDNPSWDIAQHRDLRKPVTHGTAFFSQEEVIAARNAVMADLERRDEIRLSPDLFMDELTERVLVIEAWFHPRSDYEGEAQDARIYYVRNGTILPEAVGKELAGE